MEIKGGKLLLIGFIGFTYLELNDYRQGLSYAYLAKKYMKASQPIFQIRLEVFLIYLTLDMPMKD